MEGRGGAGVGARRGGAGGLGLERGVRRGATEVAGEVQTLYCVAKHQRKKGTRDAPAGGLCETRVEFTSTRSTQELHSTVVLTGCMDRGVQWSHCKEMIRDINHKSKKLPQSQESYMAIVALRIKSL